MRWVRKLLLSHSSKKQDDAKRLGADHFYATSDPETFKTLWRKFDKDRTRRPGRRCLASGRFFDKMWPVHTAQTKGIFGCRRALISGVYPLPTQYKRLAHKETLGRKIFTHAPSIVSRFAGLSVDGATPPS